MSQTPPPLLFYYIPIPPTPPSPPRTRCAVGLSTEGRHSPANCRRLPANCWSAPSDVCARDEASGTNTNAHSGRRGGGGCAPEQWRRCRTVTHGTRRAFVDPPTLRSLPCAPGPRRRSLWCAACLRRIVCRALFALRCPRSALRPRFFCQMRTMDCPSMTTSTRPR